MNVAVTAERAAAREILGHPRGLATLFFTEMWERLSYYGMRALLVLFMTDQIANGGMNLSDAKATAIYGIYIAAVYLVALPGGWIADRLLGAQRAILYGGIVIMCGHFILAVPSVYAFFLGLIVVVLGTGLLKPNVSAVVGELYAPGDPRRDSGFTIFYMGINVGAFLGPFVCGTLAQSASFGWHYGFAAAGVGMLFGVLQFRLTRDYLGDAGRLPYSTGNPARDAAFRKKSWTIIGAVLAVLALIVALAMAGVVEFEPEQFARRTTWAIIALSAAYFAWIFTLGGLDAAEKKRMVVIIALYIGTAIFWAGFEQTGSSFNIFADRYTILEFGSFTILSTWFQSVNPVFIIVFAPVFAWFWVALAKRSLNPSAPFKFGIGLILLAVGFLTMMAASEIVANGSKVLPTWLIFTYMFHTWGELALSPVGLSATTKLAPQRFVGQMMGVWFMGTALGNVISGLIAGEFDPNNLQAMPGQYWKIFLTIGGAGLVFLIATRPLKKLTGGRE
ncbi:MAG TPA: peptide MFS transporter [Woeseiaceae bacterium]|jgi:POT family proton-dependent oligopeptide transporter